MKNTINCLVIMFCLILWNQSLYAQNGRITWKQLDNMKEFQLTSGDNAHFLHNTEVFSPDNEWIVYDTRNIDSHIAQNCCIEMVNVKSRETRLLYTTKNQTKYGPGVAAATFDPVKGEVLFIHGLSNCDSSRPYSETRRTGVAININHPGIPIFMDARDVTPPFTPGALRGGTHAHTWSGDGNWISFTYNDAIMAQLAKADNHIKDMRMVGVMAPYGSVNAKKDGKEENNNGEMFTAIVTKVTEKPKPGSNEIEKAYADGWVGKNGYLRKDNTRQTRAIAFLGDTRDAENNLVTEVYIVDVPENITHALPGEPIEGTSYSRPIPPQGTVQRRLTYTADRKYPGVQGPRIWVRSTPDGSHIFFLMKDDKGIVQFYSVSPNGGFSNQITHNHFSVSTTFNVSPDGQFLAYGSGNNIYVTEIKTGITKMVTKDSPEKSGGVCNVNWSNDGSMIAFNRKVISGNNMYYQIFVLQ